MKWTHVYTLLLAIGVALLAGAQSNGPKTPDGQMTWNSFVYDTTFYAPQLKGSEVVSSFSPGKPVTVTRVQARVGYGPFLNILSPPGRAPCNENPAMMIFDGTTSYSLPLSTPSVSTVWASSADSGPLDISFPSMADIDLRVVQGDVGAASPYTGIGWCEAQSINVTVQYRTQ